MDHTGLSAVESLSGIYALVVDADGLRRETLARILRYCGAYVQPAPSVERALATVRHVMPDVLIADVDSQPTGFALIAGLRALKPDDGGMVPAIALGPSALEETARARGFNGYLVWPFAPWQLCRLVASVTAG